MNEIQVKRHFVKLFTDKYGQPPNQAQIDDFMADLKAGKGILSQEEKNQIRRLRVKTKRSRKNLLRRC